MVAHDPLHGSQRAGLPHWALASGDDAHAAQGIRMAYVGRRQPQLDEPAHPLPGDEARLAASRQRTLPEPAHPVPEYGQRSAIHGHSLVSDVPADDRTQPLPHRGNRVVPAMPKLGFHLAQLRLQPFTHRLPKHRVPPVPLLAADVRKAEEVEGLGLGRVSLDFPTRPATPSVAGGHGISRFSREVFPYMPGVCDPRGVPGHLAIPMPGTWPAAYLHGVGTPKDIAFAAQYPACTYPCQRLAPTLAGNDA